MTLIAILAGIFSGVLASVTTNTSLDRYLESLTVEDDFISISEVKPNPVPGTYEEALDVVRESGWPSIVYVLPETNVAVYEQDALGIGVIVTTDGWILIQGDVIEGDVLSGEKVFWNGEVFEVLEFVQDTRTDLALIRVDANDLPAVAFGDSEAFLGGEIVFGLPGATSIVPNSIENASVNQVAEAVPAEEYTSSWSMTHAIEEPMPVFDTAGELVAYSGADERITPFVQIAPFIHSVLREGEPEYAGLGARVFDVSLALNEGFQSTGSFGYIVMDPRADQAILPGSPAELAGMQAFDIIVSVGGVSLTRDGSLPVILADYEPGEVASFEILRGEETLFLDITFGVLQDLVY